MTTPPLDLPALREHVADAERLGTNADVTNDAVLALLDRVEALKEDNAEYVAIFDMTRKILKDTANALNGPPPPLTSWSHHDLAEKAAALTARAEAAEAKVAAVRELHAHKHYDKYGRSRKEPQGHGAWCTFCGNAPDDYCATIKALDGTL